MMRLFKYTSPKICFKILEKEQIRFTQPLLFNDPFDSNPLIQNIYDENDLPNLIEKAVSENLHEVEELLIKSFDNTAINYKPELLSQFSRKEKLAFFLKNMYKESPDFNSFIMKNLNLSELKENSINQFINNSATKTGVFSLSKTPTNLLMWAHYANSHTGFVLEFDVSDPFFNAVENNIYPTYIEIKYRHDRPVINTNFFKATSAELYKQFELIFFTKSIDWEYEQEVRIVKKLTKKSNSGHKDLNGFPIHLFSFPIKSLKSIIVGNRAKLGNVRKIEKIINQKYKNVKLKFIELDKTEYKLNLNTHNPPLHPTANTLG